MIRTKFPEPESRPVKTSPVILSKWILDTLLKENNPGDLIGLYASLYHEVLLQETKKIKLDTITISKKMKWSVPRVITVKKRLEDLKLIKNSTERDEKGFIVGHFIHVRRIWNPEKIVRHADYIAGSRNLVYNNVFLSKESKTKRKKTLQKKVFDSKQSSISVVDETINRKGKAITLSKFDIFWRYYPKKASKGYALTCWINLCKKPPEERPTLKEILIALKKQKKTERWLSGTIPNPSTWLNQQRWLDDPEYMTAFKKNEPKKNVIGFKSEKKTYRNDGKI